MREVVEHGSRWLVLDVKGIANDTLLGLSENTTRTFSEQQEQEITRVILAGLQEEGIAAKIRHIIPPSPPGMMSLIIPILRLYLPLKDTSRDIYAAVISAGFAHAMGVPTDALGVILAPQAVGIFIQRIKSLNEEDLQIATTLSALNRELGGPATSAQLSSRLGRDVEADALRLSGRGVFVTLTVVGLSISS